MKKLYLLFLFAICLVCGRPESLGPMLARFDHEKITFAEFKYSYTQFLLQPDKYDSPELRRRFLNAMIDQRLLADEGYELGLDADANLQRFVQSYREKLARGKYLQKNVFAQMEPTSEQELEKVYGYMQQERLVRHLFAPTKQQADSLRQLLLRGKSFDELAHSVFRDSALAANGGLLGWVRWDQMDYDLAEGVFALKRGEISRPIHSKFGYHIVLVEDVRGNPILSDFDFKRSRPRVQFLIESAKKDKLLAGWIKNFMAGLDIKVNAKLFPVVASALRQRLQPKQMLILPNQAQITQEEFSELYNPIQKYKKDPIAWYGNKPLTVEEFVTGLMWVPYRITYRSLYDALGYVIRDRHVTDLALQKHYDRAADVQMKAHLLEENFVQKRYRAHLISSIKITDEDIRNYYTAHKENYTAPPILHVREIVLSDRKHAQEFLGTVVEHHDVERAVSELRPFVKVSRRLTIKDRKFASRIYDRAVFLNDGEASGPVATPRGYSVVVLVKKEKQYQPLIKVRKIVYHDLVQHKKATIVPEKLKELKKPLKIVMYEDRLKKIFEWDETK